MADILTLSELKAARGESGTENDTQYNWFITVVSSAFRNYSGRDFGAAVLTEERPFQYDGSGYLDIDDAASISSVKLVIPNSEDVELDPDYEWYAQPPRRDDSPVYYYLVLPSMAGRAPFSPEMGFTRNLDVYYRERGMPRLPTTVKVTAQWGWPVVPADVKQAAIWTVNEWLATADDSENLTSEAISGYSRSWQRGQSETKQAEAMAIPARARDILANYAKLEV